MKELCPAEALHEECGVFGIYDSTGKTNMVSAVYSALYALQHRGQESCGIALNVDGVLTGYRDLGLVSEVFTPRVLADLPQNAKMATGHVRYATSGQRTRANAKLLILHHCKCTMAICHNGNLTNAPQLRHKLEMNGSIFHGTSDTEVIGYLLTQNRLISPDIETAVCRTMEQIVGAYSLVIMTHTKLIAARDPNGFLPLHWPAAGWLRLGFCFGILRAGCCGRPLCARCTARRDRGGRLHRPAHHPHPLRHRAAHDVRV